MDGISDKDCIVRRSTKPFFSWFKRKGNWFQWQFFRYAPIEATNLVRCNVEVKKNGCLFFFCMDIKMNFHIEARTNIYSGGFTSFIVRTCRLVHPKIKIWDFVWMQSNIRKLSICIYVRNKFFGRFCARVSYT